MIDCQAYFLADGIDAIQVQEGEVGIAVFFQTEIAASYKAGGTKRILANHSHPEPAHRNSVSTDFEAGLADVRDNFPIGDRPDPSSTKHHKLRTRLKVNRAVAKLPQLIPMRMARIVGLVFFPKK